MKFILLFVYKMILFRILNIEKKNRETLMTTIWKKIKNNNRKNKKN